jgi:hypothetical protein
MDRFRAMGEAGSAIGFLGAASRAEFLAIYKPIPKKLN